MLIYTIIVRKLIKDIQKYKANIIVNKHNTNNRVKL